MEKPFNVFLWYGETIYFITYAKKCNRNALFNVNCHKRSCSVSWNTSLLLNLQRSDRGEQIKNYYFHLAWNWARNARWTRMYLDAHALNFALEAPYKACTQFRPKFKRYVPFNPDGFQKLIRSDILVTGLFINKACTVDKQVSGEHWL